MCVAYIPRYILQKQKAHKKTSRGRENVTKDFFVEVWAFMFVCMNLGLKDTNKGLSATKEWETSWVPKFF